MWYILSCAFVGGANEAGTECKKRCEGDVAKGIRPRLKVQSLNSAELYLNPSLKTKLLYWTN